MRDRVVDQPWSPSHEGPSARSLQEPPNFYTASQTPPFSLFPRDTTTQISDQTPNIEGESPSREIRGSLVAPRTIGNGDNSAGRRVSSYATGRYAVVRQPSPLPPATASQARHRTDDRKTETHLSKLSLEFTQLALGDYASCKTFIDNHPNILEENPNKLVQEAMRLEKEGRASQAPTCIQQGLLLRECSRKRRGGHHDFFSKLISSDKKVLGAFLANFHMVMNAVQAAARKESLAHEAGQQSTEDFDARPRISGDGMRGDIPKGMRHTTEIIRRNITDDGLSARLAGLEVRDQRYRDQKESYEQVLPTVSVHPPTRSISATVEAEKIVAAPSISSSQKIADGDRESLDHRYYKRPDAKKFFVVGRLFAMLWHENAGESFRSGSSDLSMPVAGVAKYGEMIYSHIRRFAVVRERHGYCLCIPINTYAGKGVLKGGLSQETRQAHAVIYSANTKPFMNPEESSMIIKQPIAVHMASSDQKLDEMSRIDFSKVYTVEWNVKVMNIGKVTRESMPIFEGYWHNECAST